jgi:hypothetical protein
MLRLAPGELVQLATRIPHALHRAAVLQAIAEDRTLMAFVAEALTEHLARCRGRPAARAGTAPPQVTAARPKVTALTRAAE